MTPQKKTQVSKTVLTIGSHEISLTPEQVRELKEALEAIYPSPARERIIYRDSYLPRPYQPYWYGNTGISLLCSTTGQTDLSSRLSNSIDYPDEAA